MERLAEVVARAREKKSRLGFFAALYLQVTRAVGQGIQDGAFDDGARMRRFTAVFAGRYFDALGAWEEDGEPPRCWRTAFEAGFRKDRLVLQHLILGINAHINLDLAVAAAQVSPGRSIHQLKGDFYRVNDTLERVFPLAQDVVSHFSPVLGVLDAVGGRNDDQVLNFSITTARDQAWRQAVLLAALDHDHQQDAIASMDRNVAFLARIVVEPGGLLERAVDVVSFTESDDVVAIIDALGQLSPPVPRREVIP